MFPQLRTFCQERGARFQAIDLRWGIGQEAAIDQQTMNICIQELRRCQKLSPRPNFIVLLGDRYGWRPLPPQIPAAEFESLLIHLSDSQKQHLLKWYRRDDNAVPSEYCLLSRTGDFIDYNRWTTEEACLREILLEAVEKTFDVNATESRKYYDSATHQEIRHGALQAENPHNHVFCYFREIDNLPSNDSARQYRDIQNNAVDTEAQDRLNKLKQEIENLLPPENIHKYKATWQGDHTEWNLDQFCEDVKRDLQQVIDQEVAAFKKGQDIDREVEAHREFAEDRCLHFIGRQDILHCIRDYLASDEKTPLIIYGKSGSGKTALMAKAWLDSSRANGAIGCFIGATPPSSDLRLLLMDLCRQMGIANVPSDMNELVKTFRDRLSPTEKSEGEPKKREPVVLFLDALDQLNPTDNARMLYWLPRELAPDVKLVMSVLQTERQEEKLASRHNDCFDLAGHIWPGRLIEIGPLEEANGAALLNTWLTEADRTLQPQQRAHVLERFHKCPLPLYLKLAFEESRRWKSWDGMKRMSDTVEGILEDLLLRLEQPQNHGQLLVSHAMGYIAAGKNGLTEDELLDVLSNDKDVMEWFHSQSPTERAKLPEERIKSLPVVVWSRLFADIEPYVTRRRADGTTVLDFYHRQVGQAIQKRYLAGEARAKAHLHLAEYFHKLDYWAESLEAQRARAKRLPPTPRPANVRKVVELPYHRLEVAKLAGKDDPKSPYWDAVADLLIDWQFLEAKAEADPNSREQESHESSATTEKTEP